MPDCPDPELVWIVGRPRDPLSRPRADAPAGADPWAGLVDTPASSARQYGNLGTLYATVGEQALSHPPNLEFADRPFESISSRCETFPQRRQKPRAANVCRRIKDNPNQKGESVVMGTVIRKNAAVDDIMSDVETTLTRARARGGVWQTHAEARLVTVHTLGQGVASQLGEGERELQPLIAAREAADDAADDGIGLIMDEIWNRIGRPASDPTLSVVFPGEYRVIWMIIVYAKWPNM